MDQFITVFITVFTLLLMAIPGFVLTKTKMLGKSAENVLSAIVLYAAQPVMMFMSFQKQFETEIAINMLVVAGVALVIHLLMIGITFLFIKNKSKSAKINCVRFASVFSNCGYMGLPFLKMLFGENNSEILIYAAVVIAVFNLITWSLGVVMMTGNKKDMSVKKALLNPTSVCIFLGLIVFLAVGTPFTTLAKNSVMEEFVMKLMSALDVIGDLVTPLSMILIGCKLAHVNIKSLFFDKWAYVSCFFKLIVMAVITMLIVAFLPIEPIVKYCLLFLLSMPSATATVLFAVQFGGDGEQGATCVLLSTILSVITILVMFIIFQQVFGVPPVII